MKHCFWHHFYIKSFKTLCYFLLNVCNPQYFYQYIVQHIVLGKSCMCVGRFIVWKSKHVPVSVPPTPHVSRYFFSQNEQILTYDIMAQATRCFYMIFWYCFWIVKLIVERTVIFTHSFHGLAQYFCIFFSVKWMSRFDSSMTLKRLIS